MYKIPTHALFHSTLYYSRVLISLKYTKIFNSTPTCFDLKRSSSGSMTYLAKITELFKRLEEFLKH